MAPMIDRDELLRELSDGGVVCTKEGDIVYSNPAFARILGQNPDDIKTVETKFDTVGIDRSEDLKRAEDALLKEREK